MCYDIQMSSETINVYDFDKTIYDGDSTVDFYKYCLRNYPAIILKWPQIILYAILFFLRIVSKTSFKEKMYRFLRDVPDIDKALDEFWKNHKKNIKSWYLEQKRETDLISSASPFFLLEPICRELGVRLIASRVDSKTGRYTGLNNHGEEKVRNFILDYPNTGINEFYSDSLSDTPMALIAHNSYLVKGSQISEWPEK